MQDFADLFDLEVESVTRLDRMAERRARNLVDAIQRAEENATLTRLIYGLGVPHVGRATAGDLAQAFGSLAALAEASEEELDAVEGIGSTMAQAIGAWLSNPRNRELISRLKERGPGSARRGDLRPAAGPDDRDHRQPGEFTRDEAHDAIRRAGGDPTGSVSPETDLLVVGEKPGTGKLDDAEAHGVETIDEAGFLELLGRGEDGG